MNAKNAIKLQDVSDAGEIKIDKKCAKCAKKKGSICCNSINQKIPTPKAKEDFDHLLWQISHENINVFKDADGWFLHINTRCTHLQPNGACGIYETRPWVCREYDNDFCEYDESIADASELFFSTPEELEKYCRKRFKKWDRRFELYE
jgi:Fe-S-cluster containining protein